MTTEEKLDKLTDLVGSIASSVGSLSLSINKLVDKVDEHDIDIDSLLELSSRSTNDIEELRKLQADTWRQFQAYLNTIHPKQ